jgi:hypothetical protein
MRFQAAVIGFQLLGGIHESAFDLVRGNLAGRPA